MNKIEYDNFLVISYKSEDLKEDMSLPQPLPTDIIYANSFDRFISKLRHIPIEKMEYLKYWHIPEHRIKNILDCYDEIIDKLNLVETNSNEFKHNDVFIVRRKDLI